MLLRVMCGPIRFQLRLHHGLLVLFETLRPLICVKADQRGARSPGKCYKELNSAHFQAQVFTL